MWRHQGGGGGGSQNTSWGGGVGERKDMKHVNSELLLRSWDLEEFRSLLLYIMDSDGTWKKSKLSHLRTWNMFLLPGHGREFKFTFIGTWKPRLRSKFGKILVHSNMIKYSMKEGKLLEQTPNELILIEIFFPKLKIPQNTQFGSYFPPQWRQGGKSASSRF